MARNSRLAFFLTLGTTLVLALNAGTILSALRKKMASVPPLAAGTSYAWGDNTYNQLLIPGFKYRDISQKTVLEQKTFDQLWPGFTYTLLQKEDGMQFVGGNAYKQFSASNPNSYLDSSSGALVSIPNTAYVATKALHTMVLDKESNAWVFGRNTSGQLATGDNTSVNVPQNVASQVKSVSVGYRTSQIVRDDGTVAIAGGSCSPEAEISYADFLATFSSNLSTESYFDPKFAGLESFIIGDCVAESEDNMNVHSTVFKTVEGLSDVRRVEAGYGHFMALKQDGTVWTWGCNLYGQVGNGTNENNLTIRTPEQVEGLPEITAISAGYRHSLALDAQGHLWAWGHNYNGELGIGTTTDAYVPTEVNAAAAFTQIFAGQDLSLALDSQGRLWGWGENYHDILSMKGYPNDSVSTPIVIAENIASFKASGFQIWLTTN